MTQSNFKKTGDLVIGVTHQAEYFNRICQATIPEYFHAEVLQGVEIEAADWEHYFLYGDGQTAEEAVDTLKSQLKEAGLYWKTYKLHRS